MVGVPKSNACLSCLTRRKKCDSKKPTCTPCAQRGVPCPGYRSRYQFVSEQQWPKADKPDKQSERTSTISIDADVLSVPASTNHDTTVDASLIQPQTPADAIGGPLPLPLTLQSTVFQQLLVSRYSSVYQPSRASDAEWGELQSNILDLPSFHWVTPTVQKAGSDTLLNDIVLSLVVGNLGLWEGNEANLHLSTLLHGRAVRRLQARIKSKGESQSDATLAAVMVFGVHELQLPSHTNGEGYWAHLRGVNALLALRGEAIHKSEYGRQLFWGSQFNQFVIAVHKRGDSSVLRPDSNFCEEEVKRITQSMSDTKTADARLFAIVQRLPPLMARVDQFQKISTLLVKSYGSIQASRVADGVYQDLLSLEKDLRAWQTEQAKTEPLYHEEPSVLYKLNSSRIEIAPALATRLCFPSVRIGFDMILSWATMLIISSVKRPLFPHVEAAESGDDHTIALNIVRAMEFFLHPDMGLIGTNMIGLSLEIARQYFQLAGSPEEKVWFEIVDARMAEMRSGLGDFLRGLRTVSHRTL